MKSSKKKPFCHFSQRIPVENLPSNSSLHVKGSKPLKRISFVNDDSRENNQNDGNEDVILIENNNKKNKMNEERKEQNASSRFKIKTRTVFEHTFEFSYLIIGKGKSFRKTLESRRALAMTRGSSRARLIEDPEQLSPEEKGLIWGRIVAPPKKRKGHVSLKLCRDGEIETRVITKSFGPQEYRQARKSLWGDLWPYPYRKVVTEKTAHRKKFLEMKKIEKALVEEKRYEDDVLSEYNNLIEQKK